MKQIKIFGERNTGTNYLKALMETNLNVRIVPGSVPVKSGLMRNPLLFDLLYDIRYKKHHGWKHGMPDPIRLEKLATSGETLFVTLIKNPYTFLQSLYRRPYHHQGVLPETFLEFVQTPWKVLRREHVPLHSFPTPVHLWNEKTRSYLELHRKLPNHTMLLTYESLLSDPEETIEYIGNTYGFRLKNDNFVNIIRSTKPDEKHYSDYRTYYLEEVWRRDFPREAIPIINKNLDHNLMAQFGYARID
jgi:hypothetical protein